MTEKLKPVHPGKILRAELMEPLEINARQLAKALDVPPNRINQIINEQRAVTADTARRLGRYFGASPEFWLNLQMRYDMDVLEDLKGAEIDAKITPLRAAGTAA